MIIYVFHNYQIVHGTKGHLTRSAMNYLLYYIQYMQICQTTCFCYCISKIKNEVGQNLKYWPVNILSIIFWNIAPKHWIYMDRGYCNSFYFYLWLYNYWRYVIECDFAVEGHIILNVLSFTVLSYLYIRSFNNRRKWSHRVSSSIKGFTSLKSDQVISQVSFF